METYDEMMQRICAYVESRLKKTTTEEVSYCEFDIDIKLESDLIDTFVYRVEPQSLEHCIKDSNGCILDIGNEILYQLQHHIANTFFKHV